MTHEARWSELLVVFLKYPEPGRVKTRLAASIGEAAAAGVYRELVEATLRSAGAWLATPAGRTTTSPRRLVWMAFDPPECEGALRAWLDPVIRQWQSPPHWVAQSSGDLGNRLQTIFQQGVSCGFSAICAIGTDCPDLGVDDLNQAFDRLVAVEGVIGPATDGGYYLIGIKSIHPELFLNIPWSSNHTLSATLEAAARVGLGMDRLRPLDDVDTQDDWLRWQQGKGI